MTKRLAALAQYRPTGDHIEIAGFACLVAGAASGGWWLAGAIAAWTFGLLVAGALLVLAGNAGGEA